MLADVFGVLYLVFGILQWGRKTVNRTKYQIQNTKYRLNFYQLRISYSPTYSFKPFKWRN